LSESEFWYINLVEIPIDVEAAVDIPDVFWHKMEKIK